MVRVDEDEYGTLVESVAYSGILFGVGVQQIQLRTEDRERGSGRQ
jgi:hypothetical protein